MGCRPSASPGAVASPPTSQSRPAPGLCYVDLIGDPPRTATPSLRCRE
jgi:hypothetical protein